MGLLEKAKKNSVVAKYANEKTHYDVAISRYYYEVYQKMMFLMDHYNIKSLPQKQGESKSSHELCIDGFIAGIEKCVDSVDISELSKLQALRIERNRADYKPELTTNKLVFDRRFYDNYSGLNAELAKIIRVINEPQSKNT